MPMLLTAVAPLLPLLAWPLLSPLERVMTLLITIVGGVTFRFSQRYLDGTPDLPRYNRWFVATLAAALTVVLADDLIVMGLAWTATSLSLHHLLTFVRGRAAAEVAAHKKFILSRLADLAIAASVVLLALEFGTTDRGAILTAIERATTVSARTEVAGALLVLAVIMRSAQLPFHGWLIQVMEAPTPVSALLHAGIVNLGAYMVLTLAPLISRLAVAPTLLVLAGLGTTVLASIVVLTRGSVKGALAWSTSAQMGFVLLECGLGVYDLALLHLVGHALYKAHAFLSSGSAVVRTVRQPRVPLRPIGALRWIAALAAALLVTGAIAQLSWGGALAHPGVFATGAILALALAGVIASTTWRGGVRMVRAPLTLVIGLPLAYGAWHALMGPIAPAIIPSALPTAIVAAVPLTFLGLLAVQATVTNRPASAFARALYPHAVAGFHLDELFTRLTFRLWPPALTMSRQIARTEPLTRSVERAA